MLNVLKFPLNRKILLNKGLRTMSVQILFALTLLSCSSKPKQVGVFYDKSMPQLEFAATDIEEALKLRGYEVELLSIQELTEGFDKRIVISIKTDEEVVGLFTKDGGEIPDLEGLGDQAFTLRTTTGQQQAHWAIGGDISGAMYGGLQIAENISFNGFDETMNDDQKPYIERRGIKFNILLDKRTPGFNRNGDQEKTSVQDVWDITFWKDYLDNLARNRYNTLSYWTKHPFTSMVKLEEYPGVEVEDVIDGYGNLVKKMTIDEKIAFWQEVMKYANNRCIDIFYFTWNIHTNTAEGKYGITNASSNPETVEYMRKCVKQFLLTYPHVDGIGVTAGEHMPNMSFDDREKWLWDTYGLGMMDVKKEQPDRKITFVHRHWFSSVTDIMSHFSEYDGPFEFSFKYAKAHIYSSPNIVFEDFLLDEMPEGIKSWWNLRNDDLFYLRWGDPIYVKDFIMEFDKEKTAGYLMGSDGYVWSRVHNNADPNFNGILENDKHWYRFMLWGRLGYDPEVPISTFIKQLKIKFPEVEAEKLFAAWQTASKIAPTTTQFFWRNWDYQWYVEGAKGKPFANVKEFINGKTLEGSNILSISEYTEKLYAGEPIHQTTPIDVANRLTEFSKQTLSLTKDMVGYENNELAQTVNDIRAFAYLGNYYSAKILGSTALAKYKLSSDASDQNESVKHLENALVHWEKYASILTKQYLPRDLDRTGKFDWNELTKEVAQDIEIAKTFKPFQLSLSFDGISDGDVYPVGKDLTIKVDTKSTYDIKFVSIKLNGENLDNDYTYPYVWDPNEYAVIKNMTQGGYELLIDARDTEGNITEKTINITIK